MPNIIELEIWGLGGEGGPSALHSFCSTTDRDPFHMDGGLLHSLLAVFPLCWLHKKARKVENFWIRFEVPRYPLTGKRPSFASNYIRRFGLNEKKSSRKSLRTYYKAQRWKKCCNAQITSHRLQNCPELRAAVQATERRKQCFVLAWSMRLRACAASSDSARRHHILAKDAELASSSISNE